MTAIKLPNFFRKQPLALGCATLCVGLAVAIYIRRDALAAANDTLAQSKSDGEHLRDNVVNASKLDEQLEAMTQDVQAIEARLVYADKLPINKQYFSKIGEETQTKLMSLNQAVATTNTRNGPKTNYAGVSYSISVAGTYPQLLNFLRRVENGEHFSRISSVTLSRPGGDENTPGDTGSLLLNLRVDLLGQP